MGQMTSQFEELLAQLRPVLPSDAALAQAIDRHEPWRQIAMKAIDDGYIEIADECVRFVEACLRRSM
jgi:hypothetical protein